MLKFFIMDQDGQDKNNIIPIIQPAFPDSTFEFCAPDKLHTASEAGADFVFIDYEAADGSVVSVIEQLKQHRTLVSAMLMCEPENFSLVHVGSHLVYPIIGIVKPLEAQELLHRVQMVLDHNAHKLKHTPNLDYAALWRRVAPFLLRQFFEEIVSKGYISALEAETLPITARSIGIQDAEELVMLPILYFSRTGSSDAGPDILAKKSVFDPMAKSIVLGGQPGSAHYFGPDSQFIAFYPWDGKDLTMSQLRLRCMHLCQEMARQFDERLGCVVGHPCRLLELPAQWYRLKDLGESYRLRPELVYFIDASNQASDRYLMPMPEIPAWCSMITDGRRLEAGTTARHFLRECSLYDGFTSKYLEMLANTLQWNVVSALYDSEDSFRSVLGDKHTIYSQKLSHVGDSSAAFVEWMDFLTQICGEYIKSLPKGDKIISRAIEYIKQNLSGKLTRQEIADAVHVSPNYLARLFREKLNTKISDVIYRERMQAAESLLSGSDMNITEIAYVTGFTSAAYFSSKFKEHRGMSPNTFRRLKSGRGA